MHFNIEIYIYNQI